MQIWRTNRDGSDLRQLTSDVENSQPSLSPDSKWIVYVKDGEQGPRLWRMSIDGSKPTPLLEHRSYNPRVSPDGKYIAYLESSETSPLHIAIIPFAGGAVQKTLALPERPGPNLASNMTWTPDAKAIIYRDTVLGIWRQRLDQEKPELIRGSEDMRLTQLNWSLKGKDLAYTRCANMQDILLLQNSKYQ